MLLFSDKNELKRRIKALEEGLSDANLLEKWYKERAEELSKQLNSMDYRHKQDEERWAEKLESYEESLKRRDLTIAELKAELNMAESIYESVNERCTRANKSLEEAGTKITELESENSYLREELHDAMEELNGHEPSKSPYPTVTINVDVRDVLAKQLAKSLKQVNEAFEKRSKEKRFSFFYGGIDYSSDSRTKLSEQFDNMFKLSLNEYASLLRLLDSLEKELEHKDFANGGCSFYSNKLQERVFITFKATKEEI
ncbi:hypothetical protein AB0Y53_21815 [Parabacteroides distasonis]|uniref:hypothetical protein n=1 Tax=Parabacteroides distasonis TaxID=823 RepID=UPI003F23CC23